MGRRFWQWVVDADDWIGEVAVDGVLALLLAFITVESLRILVSLM